MATGPDPLTKLGSDTEYLYERPHHKMLEWFASPGDGLVVTLGCYEWTSLCPRTGQPDFGTVTISYVPDERCVETKSLKLYLFAFRNERTFMEAAVNKIKNDFARAVRPKSAMVHGKFNPRGGVGVEVSATYVRKEDWEDDQETDA